MKRLLPIIANVLCMTAVLSCSDLMNLSSPKKVVVKPGDARYSLPFGSYSVAFNDYLSIDKLAENLADSDGATQLHVYDYQDQTDPTLQQYIIEYPIAKVALNPDDYLSDVKDFLANLSLGTAGGGISIPIADAFDAVSRGLASSSVQTNVSLKKLNTTIRALGGQGRTITGLSIPPITEDIPVTTVALDTNGYLKSAIVERGSFSITCELPVGWSGVTADVELSVSGAIDGVGLRDGGGKRGFLLNKVADLSGKTINGSETSLRVSGRVTLSFNKATIVLSDDGSVPNLTLVCGTSIEKIRDVKIYLQKVLDKATLSIEKPIPVHIPDYVLNCKVVKLTMQTAMDTNLTDIVSNFYIRPRISSKDMDIDASSNTEFSSIFGYENGLRIVKDVDEGWRGFYIVNKNAGKRLSEIDFKVNFDVRGDGHDPQNPNAYDRAKDTITVTELDLTKTSDSDYYIRPSFGAPDNGHIFECDELELEIDENIIPNEPIDTGLSIGQMFEGFVDSAGDATKGQIQALIGAIELTDISTYLYISAPEAEGVRFQDMLSNITGNVKATYDGNGKKKESWLIGDADKIKLELKSNIPTFASIAQNGLITTNRLFNKNCYSAKAEDNSLCDIFNARANNLVFDYDISLGISNGEKTVVNLSREQINALQNASAQAASGSTGAELSITIAIVLPLRLRITEDVPIDIMAFLRSDDGNNDLLGGKNSDRDFSEYIGAIEYMDLLYYLKNPIGISLQAMLSEENGVIGKKPMEFCNTESSLRFSVDETNMILTKNSFIPNITATLNASEISIKRNTEIKMGAGMVMTTTNDADITLWEK